MTVLLFYVAVILIPESRTLYRGRHGDIRTKGGTKKELKRLPEGSNTGRLRIRVLSSSEPPPRSISFLLKKVAHNF